MTRTKKKEREKKKNCFSQKIPKASLIHKFGNDSLKQMIDLACIE